MAADGIADGIMTAAGDMEPAVGADTEAIDAGCAAAGETVGGTWPRVGTALGDLRELAASPLGCVRVKWPDAGGIATAGSAGGADAGPADTNPVLAESSVLGRQGAVAIALAAVVSVGVEVDALVAAARLATEAENRQTLPLTTDLTVGAHVSARPAVEGIDEQRRGRDALTVTECVPVTADARSVRAFRMRLALDPAGAAVVAVVFEGRGVPAFTTAALLLGGAAVSTAARVAATRDAGVADVAVRGAVAGIGLGTGVAGAETCHRARERAGCEGTQKSPARGAGRKQTCQIIELRTVHVALLRDGSAKSGARRLLSVGVGDEK
jgi:hypothetical protein